MSTRHTIISHKPVTSTESTGLSTAMGLDLKVHGHYEGVYQVSVALDEKVKSFIEAENKKQGLSSERRFVKLDDLNSREWEKYENCFYAVVQSTQDTVSHTPCGTVFVWEKYVKPGRIYGETPRRRLVRVFVSVADEVSQEITLAPPAPQYVTTMGGSGLPGKRHVVSYSDVVCELKDKLAKRKVTSKIGTLADGGRGDETFKFKPKRLFTSSEDKSSHSPAYLPNTRSSDKKQNQPKQVKIDFEDCFSQQVIPTPITSVVSCQSSISHHPFSERTEHDDPFVNYSTETIHINPLWQSHANLDQAPPSYDQVMKLAEKYSIYNNPDIDADPWTVTESVSDDNSTDYELSYDSSSSSEDEYYIRVNQSVVAFLGNPHLKRDHSYSDDDENNEDKDDSSESVMDWNAPNGNSDENDDDDDQEEYYLSAKRRSKPEHPEVSFFSDCYPPFETQPDAWQGYFSWPEVEDPSEPSIVAPAWPNCYDNFEFPSFNGFSSPTAELFTPLLTPEEQEAARDDFVTEQVTEFEMPTVGGCLLATYQKAVNDWRESRGLPLVYDLYPEMDPTIYGHRSSL